MIVCLCNAVSDKDIYQAAMNGATSVEQLHDRLNTGTCCGICAESVSQCLNEAISGKNTVLFPA